MGSVFLFSARNRFNVLLPGPLTCTCLAAVRRSRAIFEWIFGLAPLATKEGNGYALRFWGVSDEGVAMAGDRSEREKKSLASVANVRSEDLASGSTCERKAGWRS